MHIFNDPKLKVQKKVPIEGNIRDCIVLIPEPISRDQLCKILVVDTETTGLNYQKDEVIEIAGVMMAVNKETGAVHYVDLEFDYFREPTKQSISQEITNITGITWEMVINQRVDVDVVYDCFNRADIILAHNASFDRPFIEVLIEAVARLNKPWVCSCHDPNWSELGFPKKGLEALLSKLGYWYDAHLAINDCAATAFLLSLYPEVVKSLIHRSAIETYRLNLVKTPYGYNDGVKALGFRWNGNKKYWSKEFASMEDMVEVREKIKALYGRSFSSVTMSMDTINPISRFSSFA